MKVKFKIWVENKGEVVAGNGKMHLLKIIDELGSIQKAAIKMGLSYRHAWGMIKKMEKRAGFKLVKTAVGGKEGGGAKLTPRGREFLQKYLAFRDKLDKLVKEEFQKGFK